MAKEYPTPQENLHPQPLPDSQGGENNEGDRVTKAAYIRENEQLKAQVEKLQEKLDKVRREVVEMRNNNPSSQPPPHSDGEGEQSPIEDGARVQVRIMRHTTEVDCEQMLCDGYTMMYMQFSPDGLKLYSVWQKASEPEPQITWTAEHAVVSIGVIPSQADGIDAVPTKQEEQVEPVKAIGQPIQVDAPGVIPQKTPSPQPAPQNVKTGFQLGQIGTALKKHGLEQTTAALDADVQLKIYQAMAGYQPPEIKQFGNLLTAGGGS